MFLVVVNDLFLLALRGVEHCGDRLLSISMVARDVEELLGRARHAAPEPVDEGGTCHAVVECRDGVVVGCVGKFSAALGEAPDVLVQALSQLLLAIVHVPLLARTRVRALEVPDEDSV
jgi:hypothetical protein